ncbi:hypothetical protein BH10ACT7_BH10ACT7_20500 [soil metagenome]
MNEDITVSVRPRPALLRNMLISSAVSGVPLFGVLYWLAFTQGNWGNVFIVQFVFLLFVLLGVLRYHAAFVSVSEETIVKQGFVRLTIVDREDVASVRILDTYRDGSHETLPQLLIRNASGEAIFRMPGFYWSREAMDAVAEAIGAPTVIERDPFTLDEFYDIAPGTAYWYERKRWLPIACIVVAFISSVALISWLMTTLGLPGIATSGN